MSTLIDEPTEVEALAAYPSRLPGTDAERRAAKLITAGLDGAGRTARTESIYLHPQDAMVQSLHCLIAAAGALVGQASPRIGFALVFFAAVSLYLDLNGRSYLLRSLLFRRASQNVVSRRPNPDAPARLILTATYAAERTGLLFSSRLARRFFAGPVIAGTPVTIWRIAFLAMAILLPTLALLDAGVAEPIIRSIQVVPVFALLIAAFLLGEVEFADATPAANSNASGVEGMRRISDEMAIDPPDALEVWSVALGGGISGLESTSAFLREHADELADRPTYFINIESIGRGTPRWLTRSGAVISVANDPTLEGICADLAGAAANGSSPAPSPLRTGLRSPTTLTALAGYPSITITSREGAEQLPDGYRTNRDTADRVSRTALGEAVEFTTGLIRLLDREIGRAERDPAAAAS